MRRFSITATGVEIGNRTRSRLASGAAAFLALLALAGPARADAWADCLGDKAEAILSGCTGVIDAGKRPALDLATAYQRRGGANAGAGDSEQAIEDFGMAIKLRPNYAEAYYGRAMVYTDVGETELALADFAKVIQIRPFNVEAYYNRGLLYAGNGDTDLAMADYSKAVQLK